jgi:hypothetical protein
MVFGPKSGLLSSIHFPIVSIVGQARRYSLVGAAEAMPEVRRRMAVGMKEDSFILA